MIGCDCNWFLIVGLFVKTIELPITNLPIHLIVYNVLCRNVKLPIVGSSNCSIAKCWFTNCWIIKSFDCQMLICQMSFVHCQSLVVCDASICMSNTESFAATIEMVSVDLSKCMYMFTSNCHLFLVDWWECQYVVCRFAWTGGCMHGWARMDGWTDGRTDGAPVY